MGIENITNMDTNLFDAVKAQSKVNPKAVPYKTLSDGTKVYRSACRMCHGGCGALVYVKDGVITKIEGDPESPLNKGTMCVKGLSSIEHVYNPLRILYPMKRVGERGEGKWKRISWDEALDTIAQKVKEIREKYGPETIAIGQGTGRHHFRFVVRFAFSLGTPNWTEPGLAQCFFPRTTVCAITYGSYLVVDYYGDTLPKCLLVWGHNPLVTGADGEIAALVRRCLKTNPKLIVVDPRRTALAKKADVWLQIRPGTDAALALSIIHTIIYDDLYDKDFVEKWTIGFDALKERVKNYTPEWAEDVTWVSADKIREAAHLYATTKPAAIEWGVAIEHTPNTLQTTRAIALLPALTGNVDGPGGNIFGMRPIRPVPVNKRNLPPGILEKQLGAGKYKLLSGPTAPFPAAHAPSLFEAMRTGKPYPIKAFLVFGSNPLVSYANAKEVYDALMNVDFLVVADIYMTPTAELADIVLPAATWLEVDQVPTYPYQGEVAVLLQQKIVEVGEAKPDEWILTELARRIGLSSGTESPEEIFNYQLEPLGLTFDELRRKGFVYIPPKYKKYEKNGFRTPSGKVELYSTVLEKLGYDPLPHYKEPPESPYSRPDIAKEYPLILITGARVLQYFHTEGRAIPRLRRLHPVPTVEIHPETAKKFGIRDGEWVWIETPRGRIKQRAKLTQDIHPNVVGVEHGWWFPEKPAPEHGVWESNANLLTNNNPPYDPAFGTYQLRALLCKIYPVNKKEVV